MLHGPKQEFIKSYLYIYIVSLYAFFYTRKTALMCIRKMGSTEKQTRQTKQKHQKTNTNEIVHKALFWFLV